MKIVNIEQIYEGVYALNELKKFYNISAKIGELRKNGYEILTIANKKYVDQRNAERMIADYSVKFDFAEYDEYLTECHPEIVNELEEDISTVVEDGYWLNGEEYSKITYIHWSVYDDQFRSEEIGHEFIKLISEPEMEELKIEEWDSDKPQTEMIAVDVYNDDKQLVIADIVTEDSQVDVQKGVKMLLEDVEDDDLEVELPSNKDLKKQEEEKKPRPNEERPKEKEIEQLKKMVAETSKHNLDDDDETMLAVTEFETDYQRYASTKQLSGMIKLKLKTIAEWININPKKLNVYECAKLLNADRIKAREAYDQIGSDIFVTPRTCEKIENIISLLK